MVEHDHAVLRPTVLGGRASIAKDLRGPQVDNRCAAYSHALTTVIQNKGGPSRFDMTVPSGNLVASRQPADPCANLDGFEALLPEVSKRAGCSRDGASTAAERRLPCGSVPAACPQDISGQYCAGRSCG